MAYAMTKRQTKKLISRMNMKKFPEREARNICLGGTLHRRAVT